MNCGDIIVLIKIKIVKTLKSSTNDQQKNLPQQNLYHHYHLIPEKLKSQHIIKTMLKSM